MSHKILIPFNGDKPDYLQRTLENLDAATDIVIVAAKGKVPNIPGETIYQVFQSELANNVNPMALVMDALQIPDVASAATIVILHDDCLTTKDEVQKLINAVQQGKAAAYGKVTATNSRGTQNYENNRQDSQTIAGHFWAVATEDLKKLQWPENSLSNQGAEALFMRDLLRDLGVECRFVEAQAYHMNHGAKQPSFECRFQKRRYHDWVRSRALSSPAAAAPKQAATKQSAPAAELAPDPVMDVAAPKDVAAPVAESPKGAKAKTASTPTEAKAMTVEEMEESLK